MPRWKLTYDRKGYSWQEVVTKYMTENGIRPMDEIIIMSPKVDKQAEAVYGQLIAEARGIA